MMDGAMPSTANIGNTKVLSSSFHNNLRPTAPPYADPTSTMAMVDGYHNHTHHLHQHHQTHAHPLSQASLIEPSLSSSPHQQGSYISMTHQSQQQQQQPPPSSQAPSEPLYHHHFHQLQQSHPHSSGGSHSPYHFEHQHHQLSSQLTTIELDAHSGVNNINNHHVSHSHLNHQQTQSQTHLQAQQLPSRKPLQLQQSQTQQQQQQSGAVYEQTSTSKMLLLSRVPPPQEQQSMTNSCNSFTNTFNHQAPPPPPQMLQMNNAVNNLGHAMGNLSLSVVGGVDNPNSSFFLSDHIKEELLRKLVKSQEMPTETIAAELPPRVDVYIELCPLESPTGVQSFSHNGMLCSVYRALHSETGQLYCLRRLHSLQLSTTNTKMLLNSVECWKKLQHANIVPLRQVFTTKAFGDTSVIFVYDYYAAAESLMYCYFGSQSAAATAAAAVAPINGYTNPATSVATSRSYSQQQTQQQQQQQQQQQAQPQQAQRQQPSNTRKYLPEPTIWNYIIQISSALRAIHQANLAFRSLDPTKVILTSGWCTGTSSTISNGGVGGGGPPNQSNHHCSNSSNSANSHHQRGRSARIRLTFGGVSDILTLDAFLHHTPANHRALIQHFQQEDLVLFGRLVLALATNSLSAFTSAGASATGVQDNLQEYLDMMPRHYSTDLKNLITYLIAFKNSNSGKPRSIDDIMPMIGARFYMQLDQLYYRHDSLYEELFKEIDNGRLLRLLAKLGTINERPEHQLDPNWSETGDRYMLKLFRDYLFHQSDEGGRPWLDLGHIVTNLNKFDVGSTEKICLVSRDAQNVIIVSFEELKRCFMAALGDLMQ